MGYVGLDGPARVVQRVLCGLCADWNAVFCNGAHPALAGLMRHIDHVVGRVVENLHDLRLRRRFRVGDLIDRQ